MSKSGDKKTLRDSSVAVVNYIESLLRELPDEAVPQSTAVEKSRVQPVTAELLTARPVTERTVINKPVADTVLLEQLDVAINIDVQPDETEHRETDIRVSQGSVPHWAQQPFQCLLFKVSGLTLAVPLVKLCSVRNWIDDELTRTPSEIPWYLGLVEHQGRSVKIIDTALMVLPENRRSKLDVDPSARFSHILLVDENRWGLACDSIGEVIQLVGNEVKWRSTSGKRPWLAGTAIERLCAIIDTDVFADMLNEKCA